MIKHSLFLLGLLGCMNTVLAETALSSTEQAEAVTAHNSWRSQVAVSGVTWSTTLADTAQAWANTLRETKACNMVHSKTSQLGENLFWASPLTYSDGTAELQAVSPTQVVGSWGSEKKNYNYQSNTCASGQVCGHYTQVVWKNTTEIGCGKAVCADKSQIWVCNYSPAGNYVGQKPY